MPNREEQRRLAEQRRLMDRQEASVLIRLLAAPENSSELAKTMIPRVASLLGWPANRVGEIWACKARRIEAWELAELRAKVREMKTGSRKL